MFEKYYTLFHNHLVKGKQEGFLYDNEDRGRSGPADPEPGDQRGSSRVPNRAMLRAVGFTDEDFQKPMIGVASTE